MRRTVSTALATTLVVCVALLGQVAAPERVGATPIATDAASYTSYGRVFPDPQGCEPPAPQGVSPYAEGNVCSADFIQFSEMVEGVTFMSTVKPTDFPGLYPEGGRPFSEFVRLQRLDEDYANHLDLAAGEGLSAGLPQNDGSRRQLPLYMAKVTDARSPIPESQREHFAFSLSIHGIERAGAEGGIRAIEDLVTWGATEPERPLLVTEPNRSVSVGEALQRSVIYFLFPNPDGWVRGDTSEQGPFYMRYNGNGIDLNRDWPSEGFTFRPYTPLSEPEARSFAKVLLALKQRTAAGKFTGGNDLHGQLIDRAFSFTLIGGAKRPFDKNEEAARVMQRMWAEQETRLAWSSLIKPNSAPEEDPRLYGVQFGTIWDTIDYTVTGALGDWIDSPLGLNGLGLDNEMSLSHLSNCGTGKCYDRQVEQLHVDGNKGLIYAQINLQLRGSQDVFRQPGRVAYIYNPTRVRNSGSAAPGKPEHENLPPQDDIDATITQPPNTPLEFEVQGPNQGRYNGGLTVNVTFQNAQAVSPGAATGVLVERRRGEEPTLEDDWEVVNSDYNQSPVYLQGGMTVNVNAPAPGTYRVRLDGPPPGAHQVAIRFTTALSWPDPGQIPYDVSNMDFFTELNEHVLEGYGFTPVRVQDVLNGAVNLDAFDSIVLADRFMPGWREDLPPAPTGDPQEDIEGQAVLPAPGAGERSPATSAFFEFDVLPDKNNGELEAIVHPTAPADVDLYLQRQENGEWGPDLAQGESGSLTDETLVLPRPQPGHYRLELHNWAGPAANPTSITISFTEHPDVTPEPKIYTEAQRDDYLSRLAAFARNGGNLVFTDAAIQGLRYLPRATGGGPLFPGTEEGPQVEELKVYAGHVEFNDGEEPTYTRHDLAKEINRPGSAEGEGNRRQTSEPVPTGYAIQNPAGSNLNSHPNWVVDQDAWEEAGGVTVGTSMGGTGVSFGELGYGRGRVRIIGSLLPMPTTEFDHPFGLGAHGLTFTGYQVLYNALQHVRPGGTWRLAGAHRYETSVEVAKRHWNTIDSVVIASGQSFADALAAVPLARALDAPILLTPKEGLDQSVYEYLLRRNPQPSTAYVIGGDGVISDQVIEDLARTHIPADGIKRVFGSDRFATAVAVAEELAVVTGADFDRAVVATGDGFPDALAAGPVAANYGADNTPVPLLLVRTNAVPPVVTDYLEAQGITETLIAGGTAAVSAQTANGLPSPTRVAGVNRYETAVRLADILLQRRGEDVAAATVATGVNFPDALVVGSAGGRDAIPTLLSQADQVAPEPTRAWLGRNASRLRAVYLAGGRAVLAPAVVTGIETITGR